MREYDLQYLRAAIEVARKAREHGNHPFGAVLVDENGRLLLEAENTVITENDCTGHAETNLMRKASRQFAPDTLAKCTLYTSTEPCVMCSGAIFWGNVSRVVYAFSESGLGALQREDVKDHFSLPCREVFARGGRPVEVVGPLLEDEGRQVHAGFWH